MATLASVKDITMEDVKDHRASVKDRRSTHFDILVAVAARALEILQVAAAAPPPSAAAKGGQSSSSSKKRSSGDGGEASSSSKKRNFGGNGGEASSSSKKRNFGGNGGEASSASPASKNRNKKMKCKGKSPPPPPPPPPLPQEYERVIQDHAAGRSVTAPRLVIQKELFATDVATHNNRLSIPIRQIRDEFLTAEEKREIANKKKFEVEMLTPSLEWEEEEVKFSRWDMPKDNGSKMSSSYVIIGAWNEVVRNNGLRKGMEVQLWSFRIDHKLCFALVRLR